MKKVLLVFFASIMVAASVTASPTRTVAVNPGDWIKFGDVTVTWNSNDPNASKVWYGMDLETYNQTEWVKMEFTQVSGTNVTIQVLQHFKNGTEENSSSWVDVETGEGEGEGVLISANLNENDAMYTSGYYSTWLINETITRTYPDGARQTNHINMTYTVDYFYSMNFYWDRATGILVEDSFEMRNQTGEYLTTWSIDFKITESNVWVIPEFPSIIILLLFMMITLLAVIVYKRKHSMQLKKHSFLISLARANIIAFSIVKLEYCEGRQLFQSHS